MRKSAYLKAVKEAKTLPTGIPELCRYFKDRYDPRAAALAHLKEKARKDDGLLGSELMEVFTADNTP